MKTMPTDKEIFLKVREHLLTQMERSWSFLYEESKAVKTCLYRGPGGNKCAIGCLIPDELYSERMEGNSVNNLTEGFPELRPFVGTNIDFLMDLQKVHDSFDPDYWRFKLEFIAHAWQLGLEERT